MRKMKWEIDETASYGCNPPIVTGWICYMGDDGDGNHWFCKAKLTSSIASGKTEYMVLFDKTDDDDIHPSFGSSDETDFSCGYWEGIRKMYHGIKCSYMEIDDAMKDFAEKQFNL